MPDKSRYRVAVVLDRYFGDRLLALTQDGPVWIIDSPDNQTAAQGCWNRNPVASHLEGITLFKSFDSTSPEDALIANLDTIDLHHGEYSAPVPYSVLQIIGTPKTARIEASLLEYGFDHLEDTPDGFRAIRS
jgi:hypothetical protein